MKFFSLQNRLDYIGKIVLINCDIPLLKMSFKECNEKIPNTEDIWSKIEADFEFAASTLPAVQAQKGRATKWSAKTYLAKVKIFQKKWSEAKTLLEDVYNNSGKKLVANYHDNYRTVTNNNSESIFEVQFSVNDGTTGNNGNAGDNLNWPYSSTAPGRGCCGL